MAFKISMFSAFLLMPIMIVLANSLEVESNVGVESLAAANRGCPRGWRALNARKCVKVFEEPNLNVGTAQDRCKRLNAELVSLHSQTEDNVIKALAQATSTPPKVNATGTFYYLGLVLIRDSLNPDPVTSINATFNFDGSPVNFGNPQQIPAGTGPWGTNEGIGEPNNYMGIEGCVAMKKKIDGTQAWVDIACDGSVTQGFVCQRQRRA